MSNDNEILDAFDFIFWMISSVSFGLWQGSWWAGFFIAGALWLMEPKEKIKLGK